MLTEGSKADNRAGAGGGLEQWEHHVKQWFSRIWLEQNCEFIPPDALDDLLSRFRKQKGREAAGRENITIMHCGRGNNSAWRCTLTLEDIEQAWRQGLERPLETARREIQRLVKMVRHERVSNPLVVVSGGTARNPAVRSRMTTLCDEVGIPIIFTDDFDVRITYE